MAELYVPIEPQVNREILLEGCVFKKIKYKGQISQFTLIMSQKLRTSWIFTGNLKHVKMHIQLDDGINLP